MPAHEASPPPTSSARDARLFWSFVALLTFGVFAMPTFPSQDGPNHLYTFGLIDSLLDGDPARSAFHRIEIRSPTNIALPFLGGVLTKWLSAEWLERVLLAFHLLAVATFSVGWRRVNGCAPYPAAWAGLAFAFPWSLFMGFYSFQLASDLALLLLVRVVAWRERPFGFLLFTCTAMGVLVMLFHPVAAALFVALLGVVLLLDSRHDLPRRLWRAAAVTAPMLALIAWALSGGGTEDAAAWHWSSPSNAILYFTTFGNFVFEGQWPLGFAVFAVFVFFCAHAESLSRLRFAYACAALIAVLHFLLPNSAGQGTYLTGRFAWWIPLLLLPAFDPSAWFGPSSGRKWIAPALAVFAIATAGIFAWPSARLVAEVKRAAREHAVEGRVSAAIFDRNPRSSANLEPLRHVVAWFAMEQGVVTTNYQARGWFFPVQLTDHALGEWPDIDINYAWETDWARAPVDALLTIDANQRDRKRLTHDFDSVWIDSAKRVELWRRK